MSILNAISKTKDMDFLINSYIREYDISKANINILYKYNVLTKEQYQFYLNSDRMTRQCGIGMMQRDNREVADVLKKGLSEARKEFYTSNTIKEEDVLSVKNDAVFLINKIPNHVVFDNIIFNLSATYTSFFKINGLELYYLYDTVNDIEILDVKGIGNEALGLHENHFLEFLKVVFMTLQVSGVDDAIEIVSCFYNQYVNREVDVQYYRTFNSESCYIIDIDSYCYKYRTDNADNKDIEYVNIDNNLEILRIIFSYLSKIKFNM